VRLWSNSTLLHGLENWTLFANSTEIAECLFVALITHAENQPVFIDVPNINTLAIALVENRKMLPIFECVRMYTDDLPNIEINHIFGVTTLELG